MGIRVSPKMLYDEVSLTVIGQEEAKKIVCNAIFYHFIRLTQRLMTGGSAKKCNVLLMGPTGSGKTFIVREATKALRKLTNLDVCPVLEIDCTEVTAAGWQGTNITDLIMGHCKSCTGGIHDSTIVFLDEFDKLCKPAIGNGGTDHNRGTQYNLLKLIEGTELKGMKKKVDTDNFLFILAGNFSEVRHARKDNRTTIGFVGDTGKSKYVDLHKEVEKAGMVTQLVGRTSSIAELYELQPVELRSILEGSLIPSTRELFEFMGKKLRITTKQKDLIVNNCFERKTGARGLETDLHKLLADRMFNIEVEI